MSSAEIDAPVILEARPHVHLWMTIHEAAEILDVSVGSLERKKDEGELPSRVVADGTDEVLICLPEHPAVSVRAAMAPMIDALTEIERTLAPAPIPPTLPARKPATPLATADVRWTRQQDVRKARRSARWAWAMAAAMALSGAGGALFFLEQSGAARQEAESMADQVQRMSELNAQLALQKSRLDSQLAEARQTAEKFQGQLVVERSIEDTLLKAAIRKHNALQASSTAMLDSAQ
ncbi:MAG TPA: hypothetical protein VK797_26750 [Tepidisphaeraceae bacterium]|jgi:hypothetical protein|nr:hypothetical protein [Tepidisphaeraceae bacterium]